MGILLLFAFLSGLVTILAPCIWPLLPIILSSSAAGGHRRPLGITLGIMLSFSFFTLTISYLVMLFQFDPNFLRLFAVLIIGFLGITMVVPYFAAKLEAGVSRLTGLFGSTVGGAPKSGFTGGFVTGLSLGLVWSPCAGPILATIATLGATQAVNVQVVLVTLAYIVGVGIPLFIFSYFGSVLFTKSRFVSQYTGRIQQVFGILMILTAVAIYTNYDKVIQAKLLDAFPSYSFFLNKLESNDAVKKQLDMLKGKNDKTPSLMQATPNNTDLPILAKAPEFTGITTWLNTDPLTMQQLQGKVILIDFWTYTCINCIRTLPHVIGWYEKYKDKGFVVIGVHTPEFEFEKKTANVQNAIKQFAITYPVAQDNDYATWRAYDNQYWPAKYLIDKDGNIRYYHFGEGEYQETEEAIQKLLAEAGQKDIKGFLDMPDTTPQGRLSPETYLGSGRMEFYYPDRHLDTGTKTVTLDPTIPQHSFSLGGTWMISDEYATAQNNGVLEYNFYGKNVFLVLRPRDAGQGTLRVLLDGKEVTEASGAGEDVTNGVVTIDSDRLYRLINLSQAGNHKLRLEFSPGVSAYAFTFG